MLPLLFLTLEEKNKIKIKWNGLILRVGIQSGKVCFGQEFTKLIFYRGRTCTQQEVSFLISDLRYRARESRISHH